MVVWPLHQVRQYFVRGFNSQPNCSEDQMEKLEKIPSKVEFYDTSWLKKQYFSIFSNSSRLVKDRHDKIPEYYAFSPFIYVIMLLGRHSDIKEQHLKYQCRGVGKVIVSRAYLYNYCKSNPNKIPFWNFVQYLLHK